MLELSNKEVVLYWLELKQSAEAGVYFDNDNNLMVIDRKKRESILETSLYKKQLNKCVIYLDQSHTRGTDLKFPYDTIGIVTLGRGVSKDRLMQACMRLRMLGNGHSVKFYSAFEVHESIMEQRRRINGNSDTVNSLDVLNWSY